MLIWLLCFLLSPSPVKSAVTERASSVFSSLAPLTVRALLRMARAIMLPVTRGVCRPLDPLCMNDRHKVSEDMFRLPPVSLLREPPCEATDTGQW